MFPELTRDDVFRLETRRLWLRWPRMADATAILKLAGEKAVAEMTASDVAPYLPSFITGLCSRCGPSWTGLQTRWG